MAKNWLIAVMLSTGAAIACASDPAPGPAGTISVAGTAIMHIEPDVARLDFGVQVQELTAAEALASNSERMNAVMSAIESLGLTRNELSTAQFNISPIYERPTQRSDTNRPAQLVGYRVSNVLSIETEKLDLVADIVDAAVSVGANRVDRIGFGLSRELEASSRDQLIEQAVMNARARAEQALAPLDQVITGVLSVSMDGTRPPALMASEGLRMDQAMSAPPLVAGDQRVSMRVEVTFRIGPA